MKEAQEKGSARIKPGGISAKELLKIDFPEPKWAVPSILPEGLSILGGKPKMGKSILSLNLGLAIASGNKAFGNIEVEQGTVLYFSLEDSARRLQERILQMLPDNETPPEKLILFNELAGMEEWGLEYVEEELEKYDDSRLVIIDTFAKFRPPVNGNANLYNVDYDHVSQVKELADKAKTAFLLVHHLRKQDSDDPMDTFSGSLGLTGAADTLLVMKKEPKKPEIDAVLHISGRDVEQTELGFKFNPDVLTWENLGDPVELRPTEQQQKLLNTLKNAVKKLSPTELSEITSLKVGYIKKTLPKLIRDGVAKKDSYGKYSYKSTPIPPGNSGDSGDSQTKTVPKVPKVPTPQGAEKETLGECIDCKKNYECTTCESGRKFFGKEKQAEGLKEQAQA